MDKYYYWHNEGSNQEHLYIFPYDTNFLPTETVIPYDNGDMVSIKADHATQSDYEVSQLEGVVELIEEEYLYKLEEAFDIMRLGKRPPAPSNPQN